VGDVSDNNAAELISGIYERHAETYDALRSRSVFEKGWLDRFTALLPAAANVLDIGCGMGEPIATYLVERGFRLTGADSSPAMIDKARQRLPAETWLVADMRSLNLQHRFDGILAWDSFFHLTRNDQRAMFRVFAAHAAPQCALMFTSGPSDGEAIGTFGDEPLYHASLAPEEYQALLADIGFGVVEYTPNDPTCGDHTIWLAQRI